MYDPHTKDSRGFGFVMMVDADGAARAIAELNGKEFMGKVMTVAHVRSGSRAIPSNSSHFPDNRLTSSRIHYLMLLQARRARARTPTPGRYYGPPKTGDYASSGRGKFTLKFIIQNPFGTNRV
jgi:RNA recognition motif-containing protein